MALPINITELINGNTVESERLDFKEGFNPEEVLHSICAFANDINNWGGGYIILGIKTENGLPILPPQGLLDNQLESIQNKIIEICYYILPNYSPVIEPVNFQGKNIIIIWVPGGDTRAYKASKSLGANASNKVYWIRKGAQTVEARGSDETKLLEMASKVPFDDRINHNAEVNNLSLQVIQSFLKEIGSELYTQSTTLSLEDVARKMNIARGSNEYLKPLNVGLLLFSENPENYFRGACIDVVVYEDEAGTNYTEKKFVGPLYKQLRDALSYIQINIIKQKVRKIGGQAESLRFFNYPYEAIEESLANAVYHRSYENLSPIEVNIRPDKIEILSFPGPLPPLDREMLKRDRIVPRDYRNRRIGDFLKELNLTEGRGTGIPTIRNSLKNNNSPEPVFETDDNLGYFLTILPINRLFVEIRLDDYKQSVLNFCRTAKTRVEILKYLGLTNHTDSYKRHIEPLIEYGYLEYTIPHIPRSPKQMYITSTLGIEKLKND